MHVRGNNYYRALLPAKKYKNTYKLSKLPKIYEKYVLVT